MKRRRRRRRRGVIASPRRRSEGVSSAAEGLKRRPACDGGDEALWGKIRCFLDTVTGTENCVESFFGVQRTLYSWQLLNMLAF